jgi:catechol 2,3-dioxygenase-like lactoylglutathione lyase family enzyme
MKRFHVHVGVDDLAGSIAFYSTLFAAPPSVTRDDYAKWMLDDPRVNFAISVGHATRGIEHLGIEAETADELADVAGRLAAAGRPVLDEGATTCCYAQSTKQWVADPQGIVWESFHTTGGATSYGTSPALGSMTAASAAAAPEACCAPALAPAATAPSACCG